MRFLDLLLTLIFEGRDALPKSTVTRTVTTLSNPVTNALAPATELAASKSKGTTTTTTTTTTNTTVSSSKQRSESHKGNGVQHTKKANAYTKIITK